MGCGARVAPDSLLSAQVKAAGTMCRASKNDCDLPEHCTGLSSECPEDVFQENGIPCQSGNGYCYNGACPTHAEQCRVLWGAGSILPLPPPWERAGGGAGSPWCQGWPVVAALMLLPAAVGLLQALAPHDPSVLCLLQQPE